MKSVGLIPIVINNKDGLYQGDLTHYFRVVFGSAQNLGRPYHNLRHMLHVTWQCYMACLFYRGELNPLQMRALLIAALFHDFDHPGMLGHDDLNIERAIRGLIKHLLPADIGLKDDIIRLIRATQYPYTIGHHELDLLGLIIRDADMTQALDPVWMQENLIGLANEWKMAPIDVLKGQGAFLAQLRFHTRWGQETFPAEVIAAKAEEARQLLEILSQKS